MVLGDARITDEMRQQAASIQVETDLNKEEIMAIIWEEYLYWHDADIKVPDSVFAIGPLANIIARISIGKETR